MKRIVIALGGNALGDNPKEQLAQINQAAPAMVEMIKLGYEIIISHGNGPQVGMLEKAINLAANLDSSIPHVQLPECTAMPSARRSAASSRASTSRRISRSRR